MRYRVWHATVTGPSHVQLQIPCQDSCATATSIDEKWLSVVVCDGCGSASRAQEGAQFTSDYLARELLSLTPELSDRGPGEWIIDKSVILLAELRESLRSKFGDTIHDYATTIVAALISDMGGFLLHLGDGIATSLTIEQNGGPRMLLTEQSNPENGEFANQTYYLTEPGWIRHVRITPLSNIDCLILCTDGAQALFYEANMPFDRAVIPILRALATNQRDGRCYLQQILGTPEAGVISGDDKTIAVLATRKFLHRSLALADERIHLADAIGAAQRDRAPSSESIKTAISEISSVQVEHRPQRDNSIRPPTSGLRSGLLWHRFAWRSIAVVALIAMLGILLTQHPVFTSPAMIDYGQYP